jgi:putative transposase
VTPCARHWSGHRAAFLRTLYVLFFVEIGSRRVHITMATRDPDTLFVTQQARNLFLSLDERQTPVRCLIHDRHSKFCGPFDEVLASEGIRIIRTPIRSPKANAFAERFVRTVRDELLDLTLILGERHLDYALRCYAEHHNAQRPHRGLGLHTPEGPLDRESASEVPQVRRIDVLGGLIHEYEPVAA